MTGHNSLTCYDEAVTPVSVVMAFTRVVWWSRARLSHLTASPLRQVPLPGAGPHKYITGNGAEMFDKTRDKIVKPAKDTARIAIAALFTAIIALVLAVFR